MTGCRHAANSASGFQRMFIEGGMTVGLPIALK
jgi:hypothetical protein